MSLSEWASPMDSEAPLTPAQRDPAAQQTRSELEASVEKRFGLLPNFFLLSDETPEITAKLWAYVQAAYLDNPLPSLFKERLFVYLSRFCEVRYCIARHVGFLMGLGRPSGDAQSLRQTAEQVIRLLRRPFPRRERLGQVLSQYGGGHAPLGELPGADSEMEEAIFTFASHVFLQTPEAPTCLDVLKSLLGTVRTQYLILLLSFVRTAHYWTEVHPELTLEEDIKQLLAMHEELAECILNDPEARFAEANARVLEELPALRKRAERATELLAAIVDSSDDAIISKNLDGVITTWNKSAERIFGYTAEEAVGQHITLIIPPNRHQEEVTILERLSRGERIDHVETVRMRKDGTLLDISVTISPLKDAAGHVTGASKVARDITQRKLAERTTALLAAIVSSSEDVIISKNLDGVITSWNKSAERIFGYTAEEAVGQHITLIIPCDRHQEEVTILERLSRGERIDHFETVRMRKDGTLLDISLTISPVKDDAGRVIGASKVARDITERKHLERALASGARQQKALFHLADQLQRSESLEDAYKAGLDAIFAALQCDRAAIQLCDEAGVTRFVSWRGLSDGHRNATLGHYPWKPEEHNPRPICISNIEDADLPRTLKAAVKAEGIAAVAFVPLVSADRIIGRFMTYFDAPHVFKDDETALILTIARQVAFSIGRIRAEERTRRSEEQFRSLSETLDAEVRIRTKELEERNAEVFSRSEQLSELSGRVMQMQDDERRHIARELHDSAGQTLTVLGMNVARLAQEVGPELAGEARETERLVQQLTREIRTTSPFAPSALGRQRAAGGASLVRGGPGRAQRTRYPPERSSRLRSAFSRTGTDDFPPRTGMPDKRSSSLRKQKRHNYHGEIAGHCAFGGA